MSSGVVWPVRESSARGCVEVEKDHFVGDGAGGGVARVVEAGDGLGDGAMVTQAGEHSRLGSRSAGGELENGGAQFGQPAPVTAEVTRAGISVPSGRCGG